MSPKNNDATENEDLYGAMKTRIYHNQNRQAAMTNEAEP